MPTITAQDLTQFTDKVSALFLALQGTQASGLGAGDSSQIIGNDWGMSRKGRDLLNIVLSWQDYDLSSYLLNAVHNIQNVAPYQALSVIVLQPVLRALNQSCAGSGISGVTNIDTLAQYYNTGAGGPYTGLLPPTYRTLHNLIFGSYPSAINVYASAIDDMGQITAGGGFTPGTGVDVTIYAGFLQLTAATTGFGGTGGTLSVAVSGYSATGAAATGTWTATLSGNGTLTLIPGASPCVIVTSITDITLPGGMSSGTTIIGGIVPTGRTDPPT